MSLTQALMAATVALGGATADIATTSAASECAYWRSETRPPPYIKVLLNDGRTVWVEFPKYLARVVSSEWGSTPTELRKAGALASMQYAWRYVSRWSGRNRNGRCYHIRSDSSDQIYRHDKTPTLSAHDAARWALNHTLRNARTNTLVYTPYRAGVRKNCASDAGRKLFARSATRCAWNGWGAERILEVYYSDRHAVLR